MRTIQILKRSSNIIIIYVCLVAASLICPEAFFSVTLQSYIMVASDSEYGIASNLLVFKL